MDNLVIFAPPTRRWRLLIPALWATELAILGMESIYGFPNLNSKTVSHIVVISHFLLGMATLAAIWTSFTDAIKIFPKLGRSPVARISPIGLETLAPIKGESLLTIPWDEVRAVRLHRSARNMLFLCFDLTDPGKIIELTQGTERRALEDVVQRLDTPVAINLSLFPPRPRTDLDQTIRAMTGGRLGLVQEPGV